ncbi:unnamed protein product [Rhizoctonia solani]|uniref:Uncharacterized protein n=1 Tax=Rhizoctonia solani TaxID=456999 RepID=A0A8H2WEF5_9AGAM|nr:unnamed protein product [Rhizoctonia solani]
MLASHSSHHQFRLTFYERFDSHAAVRPLHPGESTSNQDGSSCRTLVIYLASDRGSIVANSDQHQLCDIIADSKNYFPLELDKHHDHGRLIFAGCKLPRSRSFVSQFQEAMRSDRCLYNRVAIYGTRVASIPISDAFSPAINAIMASWAVVGISPSP